MSTECENVPSTMPGLNAKPQPTPRAAAEPRSMVNNKPIVVGLYGVPGSGKTFLLQQLKQRLGEQYFAFYDGSEKIATLVPGGLDAFHKVEEREKVQWRQLAIDMIGRECVESGRVGIVTGRFMFWPEAEEAGRPVYTQNDLDTFSHILYLDVPEKVILQRRLDDPNRRRPSTSTTHLGKWQQTEKTQLRDLCRNHGILFSLLSPQPTLRNKVSMLLRDFQHHNEEHNLTVAESMLDKIVAAGQGQLETMLVLDADRTLAAVDTGLMYWERVSSSRRVDDSQPLKTLFSSSLNYTYKAFRQATLLYEEDSDDQNFEAICQEVASAVTMHPEFVSLLKQAREKDYVGAVVVSCGLRRVWEKVLEREGLSETVKVIGGGRITDGLVITATVKAALVTRLRDVHQLYTWSFGDSPLDLGMLRMADQAIIVVGEEQTRSKTMEAALVNALNNDGLRAQQALLPSSASPWLDTTKLPLIQLTDPAFLDSVLCRRSRQVGIQVHHANDRNAAKMLMTPMRDANTAGPALRETHRRVGQYLATEFLPDVIGIEEYPIPHVQGHHTSGYRLLDEQKTSIVALMRGGEPMAFGINDVCPLAMFVHASCPEDMKLHHLQGQRTVVLVDSVVNNGQTVVQFVQHVRKLHGTIRIVVVAGVVQAKSVSVGGLIHGLAHKTKLSLVALRLSENKFTGKGTTDTGNRLFNTTHVA
jgi:uracil phosphoribosyltransferase/adenylate kinase/phosphoserine phosphatase